MVDDGFEAVGNRHAARQIEFAFVQSGQSRREDEAEEMRQAHGEVGVAVSVDRNTMQVDVLVSQGPFDVGAGLAGRWARTA